MTARRIVQNCTSERIYSFLFLARRTRFFTTEDVNTHERNFYFNAERRTILSRRKLIHEENTFLHELSDEEITNLWNESSCLKEFLSMCGIEQPTKIQISAANHRISKLNIKSKERDNQFSATIAYSKEQVMKEVAIIKEKFVMPQFEDDKPVPGKQFVSETTRKKMSEAHKGHAHSEETKQKIGSSNRKYSAAARERMASPGKKKKSIEHKEKIAASLTGRKLTDEHCWNISVSRRNKGK